METRKVILDTNILIDLFDRDGKLHRQASCHVDKIGVGNILVSAITEMEIIKGVRDREHGVQVAKKMRKVSTMPIDADISTRAINLLNVYHLSHGLDIPDAIVAATCIELSLPLLTYNERDVRFIDGLRLMG